MFGQDRLGTDPRGLCRYFFRVDRGHASAQRHVGRSVLTRLVFELWPFKVSKVGPKKGIFVHFRSFSAESRRRCGEAIGRRRSIWCRSTENIVGFPPMP